MNNNILVLDNVDQAGVEILKRHFNVDVKNKITQEDLVKIIERYDALVVRSQTRVTAEVLEAATKMKVVGRAGVGVDNIDVPAATRNGVIVVNSPEGNTIAAAEHTVALLFSLARHIPYANESLKNGEWKRNDYIGTELYNKVLGIIGLGKIGSHVAKICKAVGMKLIAYDPYINRKKAEELEIEVVSLEEIYSESDFITIHVPMTPETKNLINLDTMKKMKHSVSIVNCSRGGIVNEHDVITALEENIIGGAALDVFETEPLKDSPLQKVKDKLILTPHLGASTKEAQVNVAIDVAEQITSVLKGEGVTNAVNLPGMDIPAELKPYLGIADKIGSLAGQLSYEHNIHAIEVKYQGDLADKKTSALTIAVIKGILSPVLKERVNYVNALTVAKDRNINVQEIYSSEETNYRCVITVRAIYDNGKNTEVAGTLVRDHEDRIIQIDNYNINFVPEGKLLVNKNIDKPGMVGQIGTILGNNSINIARMELGRNTTDNTATMIINIDNEVPKQVIEEIRKIDGIVSSELVVL